MKKLVKLGIAVAGAYSIPPVRQRIQAAGSAFQEDFKVRERQLRAALMPQTTPLS